MTQKSSAETEQAAAPEKAAEPNPAAKAAARRAKRPAKPVKPGKKEFDFIGKVESIVVKGGGEAQIFEFGLRGRHHARQTFRLRTTDSFALNIMAPLVTSAHALETKIGIRVEKDEGGTPYVIEVASRPRLGKQD
jgi:hypothetical protein